MKNIDWQFWLSEQAIPLPWWEPYTYWFFPRLGVLLLTTIVLLGAVAFALWCWQRYTGRPIVLWD